MEMILEQRFLEQKQRNDSTDNIRGMLVDEWRTEHFDRSVGLSEKEHYKHWSGVSS